MLRWRANSDVGKVPGRLVLRVLRSDLIWPFANHQSLRRDLSRSDDPVVPKKWSELDWSFGGQVWEPLGWVMGVVARTRPSRSMEKSSLTGTRKRSIHRKDALIEDRKEASGFGGSVGLVGTVVDLSFCLIVRVRGKSTSLHKKLPSFLIVTWRNLLIGSKT